VLDRRGLGTYALIFLTYLSVIFATFITRSGVLSSVHSFSESPVTTSIALLIFGSAITFVTLAGYQLSSRSLTFDRVKKKIFGSNLLLAMFFSMICLLGVTLVCYVGLFYPLILSAMTGQLFNIDPEFFNRFSFIFMIGLTVSVFFCTFPNPKHDRKLLTMIGASLGVGLLVSYWGIPTESPLANFLIPLTGIALGSVGVRVVRDFLKIGKRSTLFKSSTHTMLHLGLVLVLLGVLLSSNTQTAVEGWYMYHPGEEMECCDITIGNILVEMYDVSIELTGPYSYQINGQVIAFENGVLAGGGIASHAVEPGWGSYCEELIISNAWRDIYISLHNIQLDPSTLEVTQVYLEIQTIHFVSLVWMGCIITLGATLTLLIRLLFRFRKHPLNTTNTPGSSSISAKRGVTFWLLTMKFSTTRRR
jgi:cytochrome c biogenesis factor